ncbi:MAG: ribosomal protein S18-alanine N-acetyltransferase [Gammaproteobacteria bacterium]
MNSRLAVRALPEALRQRRMRDADLPAVVGIEIESYAFPWSEGIFRDCLRVGYSCRVLEDRDGLCGYGILSMGAGEAHVLNLCVDASLRGCGAGRSLLYWMLGLARRAGNETAFLEVRPSNEHALRLYASAGFEQVGLRRGYYQAVGGREDAWVFRLDLTRWPHPDVPSAAPLPGEP